MKLDSFHHRPLTWPGKLVMLFLLSLCLSSVISACDGDDDDKCNLLITQLSPGKTHLQPKEKISVTVTIQSCGSGVTYVWSADNGTVDPSTPTARSTVSYTAPDVLGSDIIRVQVQNNQGDSVTGQVAVTIVTSDAGPKIGQGPAPATGTLKVGEQTQVSVQATCNLPCDSTQLTYAWRADHGTLDPADRTDQATVTYTAPSYPAEDQVYVTVYDNQGNTVEGASDNIVIIADPDKPTPTSEYEVFISTPQSGPLDCPVNEPCLPRVEGRFEGPDERVGLDVLVLVLPVEPSLGDWWIQERASLDRLQGTWSVIASLGSDMSPPVAGHKFSLYALLVDQNVADDERYAPGVFLEDFTVIPWHAASERVELDIRSP
jgi:hypothetical protein